MAGQAMGTSFIQSSVVKNVHICKVAGVWEGHCGKQITLCVCGAGYYISMPQT